MVFYGPGRAHSTGIDPLKALLRVIPACTGWSAIQTWRQKEDEPMADLKAQTWKHSSYGILYSQLVQAALPLNGLSPEISRLIKRQKVDRLEGH